ncbi:hypothetical protein A3H38_00935 [candidate division WOR-1 bacterium RIFCSPLOWO2_02_FULL_46_20]|uniref:ATPase n=2 Tax=Saganbacteria TaxID=1703751 RepID=A0A1F4RFJ1_UNCSA|nr:MAG: hypothetical protein A3J44_01480 [candidate division WOR-1 bacterium RIFCSPHIGHO2_02_FULL_45_12]OGC06253.1 MAG: hypothetical protein A3H38_00935 [candidate division WOR-1 bacterium RIFCSPLOWO2_02_FULL_46_20]OGC09872.1 MAG: hypothetical protein A3F86_05720 [candidate division WOR-1 bacterium RIFCSPLOWO2_12_FULL_45_9]
MEILGLLDTLESMILDGSKIPLTKKILINEEKVLSIIDKMRLVAQGGGGFAKGAIVSRQDGLNEKAEIKKGIAQAEKETVDGRSQEEAKSVEVLQQAYQMAKEIRDGADKYADEVLANLEATSTRILRTVKAGRDRLNKTVAVGEKQ